MPSASLPCEVLAVELVLGLPNVRFENLDGCVRQLRWERSVAKSVTKTLDILVVSDADTQSGKAKKARSYGVRIVAERSFWPRVGVTID